MTMNNAKKGFSTISKFLIVLCVLTLGAILLAQFGAFAGARTNVTLKPISLTTGLVGHWTFDGKDVLFGQNTAEVRDISGNANHGDWQGPHASTTMEGPIGQAFRFATVSPVIMTVSSPLDLNTNYTLSAWVNVPLDGTKRAIIKRGSSSASPTLQQYRLEINDSGLIDFTTADGTTGDEDTYGSVPPNTWHHVLCVEDAGSKRCYLDGVQSGSTQTNNVSAYVGAETLQELGSDKTLTGTSPHAFTGGMDDVRVYNRVLSLNEIQALYKLGNGGTRQDQTTQPPRLTDSNSGLVGHWTFDGKDMASSVSDRSGNGHNGIVMASATTTMKGPLGQAYAFGGSNTYAINLGTSDALTPSRFTIAGWVRINNVPYTYNYIYSNARDCCGTYNGIELQISAASKLQGRIWNGSGSTMTSNATIATSTWTHVAFSYSGSTRALYINGVLDSSGSYSTDPGTPATYSTYLGSMGHGGGLTYTLDGALDDMRLYSRALSAEEIKQLYDMGATTKIDTTQAPPRLADANSGLGGHWTFDGKNMPNGLVKDSSKNGNNGSQKNMATSTAYIRGVIGQALTFDGVLNGVTIPYSLTIDPTRNASFTVAGWVNPKTFVGLSYPSMYTYGTFRVSLGLTESDGTDGRIESYFNNASTLIGNTVLPKNQWSHIALVYTPARSYLYLNGVEDNSAASVAITTDSQATGIGTYPDPSLAGDAGFNGGIDDVRFYSRALSANEIQQLYQMGK